MRDFDSLGTEPVKCAICQHEDPASLIEHLSKDHPKVSLSEYVLEHGGRLWNANGLRNDPTLRSELPRPLPRVRVKRKISKVFGHPSDASKPKGSLALGRVPQKFQRIKHRSPHVPTGNPNYVFPPHATLNLIMFLERPMGKGNNVYIEGPSGTGKTELVEAVADKMNYPVTRLDCDSYITRESLIGSWVVRGKETVFQYGLLPTALMEGHLLEINEYDTMSPHVANILKPILDRKPRLVIHENGGEVIHAHPDFRVVATANTWARGDESGMFPNTHVQSIADLRRFGAFIQVGYMEPEVEMQMLIDTLGKDKRGNPLVEKEEVEWMVKVANRIREAHVQGKIDRTFSPAELVNWALTYTQLDNIYDAARLSFLNSYPTDAKIACQAFVEEVCGVEKKVDPTTAAAKATP